MGARNLDNETKDEATTGMTYEQVPTQRKNWFAILMFFAFPPALIYLLWSGPIYYERKGELKTYSKVAKIFLTIWSSGYILKLLLK